MGEITTDLDCDVVGCEKKHHARGYCNTHYARWLRLSRIVGRTRSKVARVRVVYCEKCNHPNILDTPD